MMNEPIGRPRSSTAPSPVSCPDGVNLQTVAKHYVNGEIAEFIERCVDGVASTQLLQFHNVMSDDLRRQIYDAFQRKTGKATICEMAFQGRLYQVQIDHKGREGIEMTFLGPKRPDPPPMSEM